MAQASLPGPSLDQGLSLIVVCPKIYGTGVGPRHGGGVGPPVPGTGVGSRHGGGDKKSAELQEHQVLLLKKHFSGNTLLFFRTLQIFSHISCYLRSLIL
jgi:hypothetical protein